MRDIFMPKNQRNLKISYDRQEGGQEMYGLYQQTISRKGTFTIFTVQPLEYCEHAEDGIITCHGIVGYYDYKMPIALSGAFDDTGIFHVEEDRIPAGTEDEDRILLTYVAPWLTDAKCRKLCGKLSNASKETFVSCGLDKTQAKKLMQELRRLSGNEKLVQLLTTYGIDRDHVEVLLKKGITYQSFLNHPYTVTRITEIDIYTIDAIALQVFRLHAYSFMRLCAYVRYIMDQYIKKGDTCVSIEVLQYAVEWKLQHSPCPDTKMTASLLTACIQELQFVQEVDDGKIYLYDKNIAKEEDLLIEQIIRFQNSRQKRPVPDVKQIEEKLQITYTEGQRSAFQILGSTGIKILTGPPGSGKTAVIRGLIQNTHSVKLAATTGRASQVMKKACKKQAITVHKLLDIQPYGENISSKNINDPIQAELIIIDEVSMMGLKLASQLLQAVKNDSIILLVGDEDQLQSVEYGNVLGDLIHSGVIETYRLTEVKRQGGSILENAQMVNCGKHNLTEDHAFHFISCKDEKEVLEQMNCLVQPGDQVLTTIKKNELGTKNLNSILQEKSQPFCASFGGTDYYKGNRVIMTETNYENGYFNGDMGVILGMEGSGLLVQFEEKTLCLTREDISCMVLAYAITTHKAQGSEFPRVHIILPKEFPMMLTRRMLYTAITRASKEVFLYSLEDSCLTAIENTQERRRITLLEKKLKKFVKN